MHTLSNPFFLAFKAALSAALAYGMVSTFGVFDTLSAPFVALACTSPVVMTGMRNGISQIAASGIGGLVALGVSHLLPSGSFALGIAVFFTILAVHRFQLQSVFLVAGFTVLYAFLLPNVTPDFAVEQRMLSVVAGVVAATVVNTAVSAWSYRSIFGRRLRIVRTQVGKAIGRLPQARGEAFDPVFPLLWSLGAELGDARREGRYRGRVRQHLDGFHEQVRLLALLSHQGKELGLRFEESGDEVAPVVRALEAFFETGVEPAPAPEGVKWAEAYERWVGACRSLRECEQKTQ